MSLLWRGRGRSRKLPSAKAVGGRAGESGSEEEKEAAGCGAAGGQLEITSFSFSLLVDRGEKEEGGPLVLRGLLASSFLYCWLAGYLAVGR